MNGNPSKSPSVTLNVDATTERNSCRDVISGPCENGSRKRTNSSLPSEKYSSSFNCKVKFDVILIYGKKWRLNYVMITLTCVTYCHVLTRSLLNIDTLPSFMSQTFATLSSLTSFALKNTSSMLKSLNDDVTSGTKRLTAKSRSQTGSMTAKGTEDA